MDDELETQIFIVRHGSTAWNEVVRFRGSADIPLSERGIEQAQVLARYLKEFPFSAIFTSPQRRAIQTVEILNQYHNLPIQERPELKSVNYGTWEGKLEEEVAQEYPELYRAYLEHIESFRFPQGETLEDLKNRALMVVEEALESYSGKRVLIVSHQVVTRVLICALLGISNSYYWQIGQDPCCLNVFHHRKGKFYLKLMNFHPDMKL
ncbi:MAG: histidine phosphatase family protein [Caldiserica bacterium]|jgi:broad specificity phosphatase PhoE|nr:histidine phosphatase family protein [Caldisericota bacterium]MDH7563066.1 histidine phosphatase family protein [Caldisericota bacterium]